MVKLTPLMIEALVQATRDINGKCCPDHMGTFAALCKKGFLVATSRYAGTITKEGRAALAS